MRSHPKLVFEVTQELKEAQGMASEVTQEVGPKYSHSDEGADSSEEANQCPLRGPRPDRQNVVSSYRINHWIHPLPDRAFLRRGQAWTHQTAAQVKPND